MTSTASLDATSKLISRAVFWLFIILSFKEIRDVFDSGSVWLHIGVLAFLFSILLFTYLYRTTAYTLTSEEFVIHRPVKDIVIPTYDIRVIKPVAQDMLKGTIRTFGSGGLFGYYGTFMNSNLGKMTWYMTQKRNMVLVRTHSGQTILISPDREEFIDKLLSIGKRVNV